MPITIIGDANKIKSFPVHADAVLGRSVKDIVTYGELRMTLLVPKGKGKLAAAVTKTGPTIVAPSHFRGTVEIDPALAPHADMVDKGTGIDGPFHMPVTILRPSRTGGRRGVMRFTKNGEGGGKGIYRASVKFRPSSKIERNKNFLPKTYDSMVGFTRVRVKIIHAELSHHFQS